MSINVRIYIFTLTHTQNCTELFVFFSADLIIIIRSYSFTYLSIVFFVETNTFKLQFSLFTVNRFLLNWCILQICDNQQILCLFVYFTLTCLVHCVFLLLTIFIWIFRNSFSPHFLTFSRNKIIS